MREHKITLGEMGESGPTRLLVYCADYKCAHSVVVDAGRWGDDVRLSDRSQDLRARFAVIAVQTSGRCSSMCAWERVSPRRRRGASQILRNELRPVDIESRGMSCPCRTGSSSYPSIHIGAGATLDLMDGQYSRRARIIALNTGFADALPRMAYRLRSRSYWRSQGG
jgi:hypothetical protein